MGSLGLVTPTSGQVVKSENLGIGYVPQVVELSPVLPVSVGRFLELSPGNRKASLGNVLELVGADHLLDKSMSEISGGEMRRVLLARALAANPQLLILDEPTSGVDITGQSSLYGLIGNIRDKYGCGVLLVSHNLHVVMASTDQVICLNRHLCCTGTPDDIKLHPEFVSLFGGDQGVALGLYHHHHDHEHDLHGDVSSAPRQEQSG